MMALLPSAIRAQERQDSVRIYFRQSIPVLELDVPGNSEALGRMPPSATSATTVCGP